MKTLAVIPVRMKSTRLPEKPLKDIEGKSLVQRVYEQAKQAKTLSHIVVATDSKEIYEETKKFGAPCIMTKDTHLTGSDRVAEAAEILKKEGKLFDLIANVQGDMPFISPEVIDRTVALLANSPASFGMSTVATPILSEEEFLRPATVKVALGVDGTALYFSRSPIPCIREPKEIQITEDTPYGHKHMGLYVFRPETLVSLQTLTPTIPEQRGKLEQLRLLCNGVKIRVEIVPASLVVRQVEVDTPEDLAKAQSIARVKN